MLYHTLYYSGCEAPRTIRVPKRLREKLRTLTQDVFRNSSSSRYLSEEGQLTSLGTLYSLDHTTGSLL
jgi:hypothetical protein